MARIVRCIWAFWRQISRQWKKWRKTWRRAEEARSQHSADSDRPRPGLHNAAHLFTSARPTRACKRAAQHGTHAQPSLPSQRASKTASKQIGLGGPQAPPPETVLLRH